MRRDFVLMSWLFSLLFFCSCTENESNKVLFDPMDKTILEKIDIKGNYKIENGALSFAQGSSGSAMLSVVGNWNLDGYNALQIQFVNPELASNFIVELTLQDADGKQGILSAQFRLPADSLFTKTISLPAIPPHLDVSKKLEGMRNTPYTVEGVNANLNYQHISGLSIMVTKVGNPAQLAIKRVEARAGEKKDLPNWMTLSADKFFPFIDRFGQFKHKEWLGKTHNEEDLKVDLKNELDGFAQNMGPKDRDQYGGYKFGPKQIANGRFYVKKIDGKWWMVDPKGNLFWSNGVVRVTPSSAITPLEGRTFYFTELPDHNSPLDTFYRTRDDFFIPYLKAKNIQKTFDFSGANIKRKYGENWKQAYTQMIGKRFQNWGLNTLSTGSDQYISSTLRIPYCDRIENTSAKILGAPEGVVTIRDPFSDGFEQRLSAQLLARKAELNDPWCYGYYVDNKINWGSPSDLAKWVLKSPANQSAKVQFLKWLSNKYGNISKLNQVWNSTYKTWDNLLNEQLEPAKGAEADCIAFTALIIEQYYKSIRNVFDKNAPGKLFMGCRFIEINKHVLPIAAKYSDVLTFDLFVDSLSQFKLPDGIDKPIIIGEFHFGALDRGLFHPGLNEKNNQKERGEAYAKYVRSALQNPQIIGVSWHQFSDQATTGRFDGENFQDGLTDVCDKPYPETVSKLKEIGQKLYQIRTNNKL